ncbi:hypothetical protein [Desulfovibrio ferrophilus]|uniref:Uncharacterized protein n=1 Tax=Desulfovibrio ferrophilus TaxID=241368 RepID=A0A2Z6AZW7_9BACT|nr:hypothetical protein [Desulfovibrio ferrophilus]BBD08799.1 uncharacterized protein DFE_2073 [Desulfovibrio ferrophilus]
MNALRRLAALTAVLSLALLCMGMGGFGDTDIVKKIPAPDRSFTVTILDDTDTTFTVSDFSVEGLTLVPVHLGKANMAIDFAKVKNVTLFEQGSELAATIVLSDGSTKKVTMSPKTMFYGRTPWGLMQLKAGDIKEIHF